MVLVNCKKCEMSFDKAQSQIRKTNNNFCSKSCAAKYNNSKYPKRKKKERIKVDKYLLWKNGDYDATVKAGLSKFIRQKLIEEYSGKCFSCGWFAIHPITQNFVIEVNHIDGNYKNNHHSNIELLCPNCHALTPNYRALNLGKGRNRYK